MKNILLLFSSVLTLLSCNTIPKGVSAVTDFDQNKYLGTWYEIARFDFRFEEGLNNTSATYSINRNGSIRVVNRGYDYAKDEWTEAVGKAKFVKTPSIAMLKVSFFGPFYAGYNVIAIDPDYKYALISGKNREYLWILSREKSLPEKVKSNYLQIAKNYGYAIDQLIWVDHNREDPAL